MDETTTQAEVRKLKAAQESVIASAVATGADAMERAIQNGFETAEAVRREALHAAFAAVELAETLQGSAMKLVRDGLTRLGKATEGVSDGLQGTALALVKTVRGSSELVARTAESMADRATAKAA
jgi:hypothetical protein